MTSLILEGETLGEKHRHYNQLLSKATETFQKLDQIDYDAPDIDNLFKIDVACHQRDIQYILNVLKCKDMLYVSKAIKKSKWLITDDLYADIINPNYLHNELFPQMTSKAKCKLMLQIRLLLKDEKRAEQFFDFFKEDNLQTAFKWLPKCSHLFIESVIETHARYIPSSIVKRLCEKSLAFLDKIFCRKIPFHKQNEALKSTSFALHKDFETYLSTIEKSFKEGNRIFHLNAKVTKMIMKNCPDRMYKNIEMYLKNIDIPTFAKYIRKEEIQDFIKTYEEKAEFKSLFVFKNLQYFLKRLPDDVRFDFVKENFIEKGPHSRFSNVYKWYQLAPFDVAMNDLKKYIRAESNPTERKTIFNVLLNCAGSNMQHVQRLLDFYRKYHINEPYIFKIQFVDSLIRKTKTHEYEENNWALINDLFISMDIYRENNNNEQECVKAVILYNVLHNKVVPDIIENKFEFDTFKYIQRHLNEQKKDKLFCYLYNYLYAKLSSCDVLSDSGFAKDVQVLENVLRLLIDWNKNLSDYPTAINKIRQLLQMKKDRALVSPFVHHCLSKNVRRIFFEESIFLNPTEEACINALKHNPQLLDLYKQDVQNIYLNDLVILKKLLNKIRIFWSQSIAQQLKTLYIKNLNSKTNYKSAVTGLCVLLKLKDTQELVKKYAPSSNKITWSHSDEDQLAIQRNLGKRMHLARPQLPVTLALLYAKGDYLQYALPSINALMYNISAMESRAQIENVLNAPVSLQKHGIRIVRKKMPYIEVKHIFSQKWETTKNKSIRSCIFKQTFEMLRTEKDPSIAQEIWELLSTFIDQLTTEEDKNIYLTLRNVHLVPLPIKVCYWFKSYKFLKSLPAKAKCFQMYQHVKSKMYTILEFLSVDCAVDVFKDFFESTLEMKCYLDKNVDMVAVYLLSTKNKDIQQDRYEKVFLPILENALSFRNKQVNNKYYDIINGIVKSLIHNVRRIMGKMIMPIALLKDILECLERSTPKSENYILFANLKLTLSYIQILENTIVAEKVNLEENNFDEKYDKLYPQTVTKFSKNVIEYLREDINEMYSTIYLHFSDALGDIIDIFYDTSSSRLKILQTLVENDDSIEIQLLVLILLQRSKLLSNTVENEALTIEILNKIEQHPSGEVNMHYWCYRRKIGF